MKGELLSRVVLFFQCLVLSSPCYCLAESVETSPSCEQIVFNFLAEKQFKRTTDLCRIMSAQGSDKGNHHNYTTLYEKLFGGWRNRDLNILEVGLGTNYTDTPSNMGPHGTPGASLRGWASYFPHAQIVGVDIDKRILFQEPRIHTFYCDQRSPEAIAVFFSEENVANLQFDIIVDDGLHAFEANLTFLRNSIDRLSSGGIYIVEDLLPVTVPKFREILDDLKSEYGLSYINIVPIPGREHVPDNVLLVIQK